MKRVLNEVRIFMDENGRLYAMIQNSDKFVVHPLVLKHFITSDPNDCNGVFVKNTGD